MGKHSYETRDMDREGLAELRAKLIPHKPRHAGELAAETFSTVVKRHEALQQMRDHADILTNAAEALWKLADKFGTEDEMFKIVNIRERAYQLQSTLIAPQYLGHISR